MQFTVRRGATRRVVVIGPIAFKFAIGCAGRRCNLAEADLYHRNTPERRADLCPVIACSQRGALLLAKAVRLLTQSEFDELHKSDGFPKWTYDASDPRDRKGNPFETHKRDDWGWLNGKLVAVDYAAPEIADPDQIQKIVARSIQQALGGENNK